MDTKQRRSTTCTSPKGRWRRRTRTSVIRLAVTMCLVATCAGCGGASLSQVKQFGMASSSLGEHARKAFELADDACIDRQIYDVAADTSRGPTDDTFAGLFTGDTGTALGKEKADRLNLRLSLLDELADYSNALQKLAEADFASDIDAAAKDLNGSLVGLNKTYKEVDGKGLPISDDDFRIITTAVDAIGKEIDDKKRREAIKIVIVAADPAVQSATKLIADDLGEESELAMFVTQALGNSRGSVQQAYNLERGSPNSTFERRYAMLERARQLYNAEMAAPAFFEAIGQGAAAVGRAHRALLKAAEAGDFSSAEGAKLIGLLEARVKDVRAFYKSLGATD